MAPRTHLKLAKPARPRRHDWTTFELHTLMCLLLRNVHKTGIESDNLTDSTATPRRQYRKAVRKSKDISSGKLAYVDIATALNKTCNTSNYENDISVQDVREMVDHFLTDRKAAVAVAERQTAARLTRSMKNIWYRGLNFDGTKTEWDNGRKAAEEIKRQEDSQRRLNVGDAGLLCVGTTNIGGVADGWAGENAPAETEWGAESNDIGKETSLAEKSGAWGEAMELDPPVSAENDAWGSGSVPKTNTGDDTTESSTDLWNSGAVGAHETVHSNAMDLWDSGVGGAVSPKLTTTVWGEPGTSDKVDAATVESPPAISGTKDPFASPLHPSGASNWADPPSSRTNGSTIQSNAWGALDKTTSASVAVDSNLWGDDTVGSTNQVSGVVGDNWGATEGNSNAASSVLDTVGSGTVVRSSLSGAKNAISDAWITDSVIIPPHTCDMGWTSDDFNVPANFGALGSVELNRSLGSPSSSFASERNSNPWESLAADPLDSVATTVMSEWGSNLGKPATFTPNTQLASGQGISENIEYPRKLWGSQPYPITSQDPAQTSHIETTSSISHGHNEANLGRSPVPVPGVWAAAPMAQDDKYADPLATSSAMSSWAKTVEGPSQLSVIDPSLCFQIPNRHASNSDTVTQLSGSGINPERLAMMAAAAPDEEGQVNVDLPVDKGSNWGQPNGGTKTSFGSKDNAIPLKFNRLTGKSA